LTSKPESLLKENLLTNADKFLLTYMLLREQVIKNDFMYEMRRDDKKLFILTFINGKREPICMIHKNDLIINSILSEDINLGFFRFIKDISDLLKRYNINLKESYDDFYLDEDVMVIYSSNAARYHKSALHVESEYVN